MSSEASPMVTSEQGAHTFHLAIRDGDDNSDSGVVTAYAFLPATDDDHETIEGNICTSLETHCVGCGFTSVILTAGALPDVPQVVVQRPSPADALVMFPSDAVERTDPSGTQFVRFQLANASIEQNPHSTVPLGWHQSDGPIEMPQCLMMFYSFLQ